MLDYGEISGDITMAQQASGTQHFDSGDCHVDVGRLPDMGEELRGDQPTRWFGNCRRHCGCDRPCHLFSRMGLQNHVRDEELVEVEI